MTDVDPLYEIFPPEQIVNGLATMFGFGPANVAPLGRLLLNVIVNPVFALKLLTNIA